MQLAWIINRVFSPARVRYHLIPPLELRILALDDFSNGAGAHDAALGDGRDVETGGVDTFGYPAALGGVIGEVEGFYEDLAVFEGGKGVGFEGEGWLRAGELREVGGFVGEDPFFCVGWG